MIYSTSKLCVERGDINVITWKRLQYIDWLLSKGTLHTVTSIAESCNTTPSTASGDIQRLEILGVPIVRKFDHVRCITYLECRQYLSKVVNEALNVTPVVDNSYKLIKLSQAETMKRRAKRKEEYRLR